MEKLTQNRARCYFVCNDHQVYQKVYQFFQQLFKKFALSKKLSIFINCVKNIITNFMQWNLFREQKITLKSYDFSNDISWLKVTVTYPNLPQ